MKLVWLRLCPRSTCLASLAAAPSQQQSLQTCKNIIRPGNERRISRRIFTGGPISPKRISVDSLPSFPIVHVRIRNPKSNDDGGQASRKKYKLNHLNRLSARHDPLQCMLLNRFATAMAMDCDAAADSRLCEDRACEGAGALTNGSSNVRIPVLGLQEIIRRLQCEASASRYKLLRSMYSSVVGAITTDVAAMVVPLDDHMVHRGHSVFDTTGFVNGNLYELDIHLNRFLDSAAKAKITPPFNRATIREILIQTVAAGRCKDGTLRFWLSAGRGNFDLSTTNCKEASLFACLMERNPINFDGNEPVVEITAVTSTVPIKPKAFATIKSTNYLPNALALREAEEKGAQAGIWLDEESNVAEGNNLNIGFVSNEGEVLLPPFDSILPGCTARRLLHLVPELVKESAIPGLKGIRLAKIPVTQAKKAAEMMLLGSFVTILPVVQWDGKPIGNGKPGRISMALRKRLQQYMLTGPRALLTPVPWNAPAASCYLKDHPPICSNTSSVRALDGPEVDIMTIRQKTPEQMLQGLDRIACRPIVGIHVESR